MCDHVCLFVWSKEAIPLWQSCWEFRLHTILTHIKGFADIHHFGRHTFFVFVELKSCAAQLGGFRRLMLRYTLSREVFGSTWSTYIIWFLEVHFQSPPQTLHLGPCPAAFWLQTYPCDKVLPTILTRPWILHCCIMTERSCNKSSIEHSGHMFLEGRTSTTLWKV